MVHAFPILPDRQQHSHGLGWIFCVRLADYSCVRRESMACYTAHYEPNDPLRTGYVRHNCANVRLEEPQRAQASRCLLITRRLVTRPKLHLGRWLVLAPTTWYDNFLLLRTNFTELDQLDSKPLVLRQ